MVDRHLQRAFHEVRRSLDLGAYHAGEAMFKGQDSVFVLFAVWPLAQASDQGA
jgi:hypothetical protein